MQTSWRLMKWRGVPVVLSWTVLLGLPWFYYRHHGLVGMATAFVCFFFLMLIHELGHAAMAKWRRVPVIGIQLYIMHGLCRHEEPRRESDAIWIAWGGVAAQGVVLLLAIAVSELLQRLAFILYLDARPALEVLIATNLFLIVMNLVPVPPLDGAIAWRVVPKVWARMPKPSVKRWLRNRKLQRQSKEVAADIIERLKKRQ
jgi:stage IV sporulation protein FB